MNDVLNSQGYTQAAWWNRIPVAAWGLMVMIAVFANALVGFGVRDAKRESRLLLVLPLVVAIAFFLSRISIARGVGRSGYIRKIF